MIQQLAATSESERDLWIQALHMASFEYMKSQLSSLKEKLSKIVNDNDSSEIASKRQRSFTSVSSKNFYRYFELFLSDLKFLVFRRKISIK